MRMTLTVPAMILGETSLSFLGLRLRHVGAPQRKQCLREANTLQW